MDQLEIQGKIYISSKRAHELTGYAKDYVGQLAREGKIPASRVGRSWYVSEVDLLSHAGVTQGESSEAVQESSFEASKEVDVGTSISYILSQRKENTLSLNDLQRKTASDKGAFKTWGNVRYIRDESDLYPRLNQSRDQEHVVTISVAKPKPIHSNVHTTEVLARVEPKVSIDGVKKSQTNSEETGSRKVREDLIQKARSFDTNKSRLNEIQRVNFVNLIPHVAIFTLVSVGIATLGGFYAPSEWSFNHNISQIVANTASSESSDLILTYFSGIFNQGIDLLASFVSTFLSLAGQFFTLGLQFVVNLLQNLLG